MSVFGEINVRFEPQLGQVGPFSGTKNENRNLNTPRGAFLSHRRGTRNIAAYPKRK